VPRPAKRKSHTQRSSTEKVHDARPFPVPAKLALALRQNCNTIKAFLNLLHGIIDIGKRV
jgi:hypothetical protein